MKRFDLTRMGVLLLPLCLRRPIVAALLRSALSVVQSLHDLVVDTHTAEPWGTHYRLRHNGQVAVLESLLNDRFDPKQRRITIGDTGGTSALYIYTNAEVTAQPHLLSYVHKDTPPLVVDDSTECIGETDADFVVNIPVDLASDELRIRASVDDNKVAGVSYGIRTY